MVDSCVDIPWMFPKDSFCPSWEDMQDDDYDWQFPKDSLIYYPD